MKSTFIMSVVGPDSSGIIKSIADLTREFGGEWVTSKVMRLAGQLAAIMKVSVEQGNEDLLKNALKEQIPTVHFFYSAEITEEHQLTKDVSLVISAKDRPGLTREINEILNSLNLEINNIECNRVHVSTIGEAVFTAKVNVVVRKEVDNESIAEEIESLSDEIRVDAA